MAEEARTVVITDCDLGRTDAEREVLEEAGLQLLEAACTTPQDVIEAARGASGLIVQWVPITAEVVAALDDCRIISRYGIGVDNVDVEAATRHGIAVANVSDYCLEEVANHAMALLLAAARRLPQLERSVRAGEWEPMDPAGRVRPLSETTLGLVGLGRTARLVAKAAQGFGMDVIAADPYVTQAPSGVTVLDLATVLERSDFVSLHAPLSAATRGMIDAAALAKMRPDAILINTARGGLVDEPALVAALQSGRLGGAALDVYASEPLPDHSALRTLDNVIVTPHAAWYSATALPRLQRGAARNVADFLRGVPVRDVLNGVEPRDDVSRCLNRTESPSDPGRITTPPDASTPTSARPT
jgi:D-3-phosphoglycerate dehydrogenase